MPVCLFVCPPVCLSKYQYAVVRACLVSICKLYKGERWWRLMSTSSTNNPTVPVSTKEIRKRGGQRVKEGEWGGGEESCCGCRYRLSDILGPLADIILFSVSFLFIFYSNIFLEAPRSPFGFWYDTLVSLDVSHFVSLYLYSWSCISVVRRLEWACLAISSVGCGQPAMRSNKP